MKMLGIVAVGVVRQSRKFSGHPYVLSRAHCAVIFAIAQLSCTPWTLLTTYELRNETLETPVLFWPFVDQGSPIKCAWAEEIAVCNAVFHSTVWCK